MTEERNFFTPSGVKEGRQAVGDKRQKNDKVIFKRVSGLRKDGF